MTPQEMKQLAELLQKVPGIKSIELKDVEGLAQLLRDAPEIGSIEVKGFFGTGVVIGITSACVIDSATGRLSLKTIVWSSGVVMPEMSLTPFVGSAGVPSMSAKYELA